MTGGIGGIPVVENGGFGRLALKLVGDSPNGVLVTRRVDNVMLSQLRIERFGECGAQFDRRQVIGPAAQRMAVMIDRGLVPPRVQELAGSRLSTCKYAV